MSVTPADGVVYFITLNSKVFAVREDDGTLLWRKNLSQELNSKTFVTYRNTPVVHKEYLFVGINGPGVQIALDRQTANLLWTTLLDRHSYAGITS